MMLLLYLAGSALAIGLIALLMHRLGHSAEHQFADEAAARDAFLEEFPDAGVSRLDLGANGRAALLELQDGYGLIRAMGRFSLARQFALADIARLSRRGASLQLRLTDYADPVFVIDFGDETTATRWQSLLSFDTIGTREKTG
ncbi:hypothetical protein [Aquisalinus flavus]|uniref:Uncharacterized protein n=1 Tax=Aquisalinus flavus TaxID=1526572 RepID=A0A8J2Y8A6_9PROT|nr:hypothetical protein [Aquisalinus flavus]MBD0425233.1 hypothetical protein [Aquisalinus flavus]UNE49107.1 hypothetical protein FF099_14130 [Aquisalinus flavus]GGD17672.1 hypothetical protein GCM10011342_28120 [Aquisalinus flavus]